MYALNKIDAITMEELDVLDAVPHYCPISSHFKWNLDGLMDMVFEYLNMTRGEREPLRLNSSASLPRLLINLLLTCSHLLLTCSSPPPHLLLTCPSAPHLRFASASPARQIGRAHV